MKLSWPTKKLKELVENDLIELKRGQIISEEELKNNPGNYPVYSSSIQNNGLFGYWNNYMFDEEIITWSVDGGGNFFYRPKHKFSVTNVVGFLRSKIQNLKLKFLFYSLKWQHSKLEFDYVKKAHPSVIKNLYFVFLPPLPLQQKIVFILDTIEKAIEIQKKIIEKTKELKKAVMNRIFNSKFKVQSSKLQFKIQKWVKLEEICRLRKEQSLPTKNSKYIGLEHLNSGEIFIKKYGVGNEVKSLKNKFYAEDILYGKLRPYLDKAVIADFEGICSTDLLVLICDKKNILPLYLVYLIHTNEFLSFTTETTHGTNHPRTSWNQLRTFKIPLPPLPEQQEIVEILQTIDKKIELEEKKKALYEELFSAMLDKLMRGEIDVENINFD